MPYLSAASLAKLRPARKSRDESEESLWAVLQGLDARKSHTTRELAELAGLHVNSTRTILERFETQGLVRKGEDLAMRRADVVKCWLWRRVGGKKRG